MRLVDDRGVEQGTAAAGVGDREGAAGQVVGGDLVRAGALGHISDRASEPRDVEVSCILDDRNDEAALGVDRDGEVLLAVVDDVLPVDACIDRRVSLEGFDGREGKERQVAQAGAFTGLEVSL